MAVDEQIGYRRKGPEDFAPGDRVRINIEPGCPAAILLHGFHHKQVNTIVGTIAWITEPPPSRHPDHIWRVVYDDGYYGWHKPSELVDYIYEVLAQLKAEREAAHAE